MGGFDERLPRRQLLLWVRAIAERLIHESTPVAMRPLLPGGCLWRRPAKWGGIEVDALRARGVRGEATRLWPLPNISMICGESCLERVIPRAEF